MSTETKTPKTTRKSTRERRTLMPITLGQDASEEEAEAAFSAVVFRTPLSKQLYALEVGVPKKVEGEFTRVKGAIRSFEKKHGAKFKIGKSPINGDVIIQRLAPETAPTEGTQDAQ